MKIIARLTANCEIRLSKQSDDYVAPCVGDGTAAAREARYAKRVAQREFLSLAISDSSHEYVGTNKACPLPKEYQITLDGQKIPASLPEEIDLPQYIASTLICDERTSTVRRFSVGELIAERRSLDIFCDSHRASKIRKARGGGWGVAPLVTRFTRKAKHSILCASAIMEREYRKSNMRVLTTTIPGTGKDIYDAVSRYSGWIVDIQQKAARRAAEDHDMELFAVWELQKRGALHQHWAIASDRQFVSANVARAIKDAWYRCLDIISEKEGINLYLNQQTGFNHSVDRRHLQSPIQRLRKSIAGYFGKYASKTASSFDGGFSGRVSHSFCPSRWWIMSASLRAKVKAFEIKFEMTFLSEAEADSWLSEFRSWLDGSDLTKFFKGGFTISSGTFHLQNEFELYYVSHESLMHLRSRFLNRVTLLLSSCERFAQSFSAKSNSLREHLMDCCSVYRRLKNVSACQI